MSQKFPRHFYICPECKKRYEVGGDHPSSVTNYCPKCLVDLIKKCKCGLDIIDPNANGCTECGSKYID